MIIFYQKTDGAIIGTIDGRIHGEDHLRMWVGSKEENDRIIVQWKPVKKYKDESGRITATDYSPDHPQKELFVSFEKKTDHIRNYKVKLKNNKAIKFVKK